MSYRILCDEHVEPQTVRYLERSGHEATHVRGALSLGVDVEYPGDQVETLLRDEAPPTSTEN